MVANQRAATINSQMTDSNVLPSPAHGAQHLAAKRFFAWWRRQLAELAPSAFRSWWQGFDRAVFLSFDGDRPVFQRHEAGKTRRLPIEPNNDPRSGRRSSMTQRLSQEAGSSYRLFLIVPQSQVLRKTVTLPLAVEENLGQTLSFELDRLTPFNSAQAYFTYRILERQPEQQRISVELTATPRSSVDAEVAKAQSMGLSVHGAISGEDSLDDGVYRSFLPTRDNVADLPSRYRWRLLGTALAAFLAIAALVLPVWQKREAVVSLLPAVARAKATAEETSAIRTRLDAMVEQFNLLPKKKWDSYSTVLILEELSKRLPDDTFVVQLDFDGKTIQIQGETGSSATLVEALEASAMFKDVGFKSQLYKIQGTQFDRYHIEAILEAGAIPRPVPPPQDEANALTAAARSAATAPAPQLEGGATVKSPPEPTRETLDTGPVAIPSAAPLTRVRPGTRTTAAPTPSPLPTAPSGATPSSGSGVRP